jgi:hypothetical protein
MSSTIDLTPMRECATQGPKCAAILKRTEATLAALAADEAKHTCKGTVAGALTCKRCLSRKATNALGATYKPQVVTDKDLAQLLDEYSGIAAVKRAVEEAQWKVDFARICDCGHPFTSHRSRDPKDYRDMSPWGSRPDCDRSKIGGYHYQPCQCHRFREPVAQVAPPAPTPKPVAKSRRSRKVA